MFRRFENIGKVIPRFQISVWNAGRRPGSAGNRYSGKLPEKIAEPRKQMNRAIVPLPQAEQLAEELNRLVVQGLAPAKNKKKKKENMFKKNLGTIRFAAAWTIVCKVPNMESHF